MADFGISNEGNIFMVAAHTKAAKEWLSANVEAEGWQWFGGALAVDHHLIGELANGIVENGFTIE